MFLLLIHETGTFCCLRGLPESRMTGRVRRSPAVCVSSTRQAGGQVVWGLKGWCTDGPQPGHRRQLAGRADPRAAAHTSCIRTCISLRSLGDLLVHFCSRKSCLTVAASSHPSPGPAPHAAPWCVGVGPGNPILPALSASSEAWGPARLGDSAVRGSRQE